MVERSASTHVAQLLRRALQRADSVFAQSVGPHALTRSQFDVLNAVKQSGGGVTQNALVELTGTDRSSMADLVARLVKRGWLRRRRADHDKRANAVQLTAKGESVFAAAELAARQTADLLLAPLSQAERVRFLRSLELIVERE